VILLTLLSGGCVLGPEGTDNTNASPEGTLTLFGVSPTTLDPAVAREGDSLQYIVEIFSGLVRFDPDLQLVGDIAERWERTYDGRTYVFYLRKGIKFHDGREVTAYDFEYSLERASDPVTGSQTADTYLGDIIGVREKLAGLADNISGLRVLGDHVLQITIDAPKEYFLSKLTHPAAFVVDRSNVESGNEWWKTPNGTGPFRLKEWQADQSIVLERNNQYYQSLPGLKEVVYRLWAGIPITMYERGEIDVADVYLGDIERVLDPTNLLNKELYVVPGFSLFYIGFNTTRPPFDDAMVRRAFVHAIDKNKIINLVLKGMKLKAHGILPPGLPGYNQYVRGLDFDVDRAKTLISESKYEDVSNLPPVTLTSSGRDIASNIEAALVDMWQRNLAYPYIIMEEKDELFVLGWAADYPDPQNFLDVLFHSGAKDNMGEYSSYQVDVWLEEAGVESDVRARETKYWLAEQMIIDDAACLPLFFDVSYTLVKPYVHNLILTPLWMPRLMYVSVESS
jgi:oligopeptide transport system substrate-binding protein